MTDTDKQIVKRIFSNIKRIRKGNNLTQDEVALRLNVSASTYSRIENGLVDIELSRLVQIAAVFGISVMQLIDWDASCKLVALQSDLSEKAEKYDVESSNLRCLVVNLNDELYQKIQKVGS